MSTVPLLVSLLGMILAASSLSTSTLVPNHPGRMELESAPTVSYPATPSPDACATDPRDAASLRELLGPPEAIAFPTTDPDSLAQVIEVPIGQPADSGIADGVAQTVHEFIACFNAGDVRRAFALVTDRYLRDYGDSTTLTEEDIAFLIGEPVPVPAEERTALVAITDISVLADGRAGAFVVTFDPFLGPETGYMVFRDDGDRWLVDEIVEFL